MWHLASNLMIRHGNSYLAQVDVTHDPQRHLDEVDEAVDDWWSHRWPRMKLHTPTTYKATVMTMNVHSAVHVGPNMSLPMTSIFLHATDSCN